MNFNNMHNVRQYKIELTADAPNIDIVALKNFGVWMNPYDKFYVLTLTDAESPYTHSQLFIQDFFKKTGLKQNQVTIQSQY